MSSSNLKVGTKLGLGFAAVIVMLIVVAIVGITSMRSIQTELNDVVHDKFPKTEWANNIVLNINVIARSMRNTLLESKPEEISKELVHIEDARAKIKENLDKMQDTIKSEEGKAMLAKVVAARTAYVEGQAQFLKLAKEGKQDEAKNYLLDVVKTPQAAYITSV